MKNSRLAWMLALLLLGTSCRTDDSDSATPPETVRRFSLEEALAACEQARSQTRAANDEGVLAPGETDIFWETAAYSQNEYGASYDVEIFVDRCYQTVRTLPDGRSLGDLILPRLVVVKAAEIYERTTTAYLAYYIPDPDESRSPVDDPAAGLLNSLPKPGFSGRILYTSLAGFPVAAAKYGDGELLDHAFLFEETDSRSILRSVEHYNRLVADIRVSPVRENGYEETRTMNSEDGLPKDGSTIISPVEVIVSNDEGDTAPEITIPIIPDIDWKNFRPTNPVGLVPPGRPGAGPGGNSGRDNSDSDDSNRDGYSKNPNIRVYDDVTQELLDELYDDCMGQTLLKSINHNISIYIDNIPQADLDKYRQHDIDLTKYLGNNCTVPFYIDNSLESVKIFFADGGANGGKRGYILMEELIHAYQSQALSRDDYNNQRLNNEIEAKVGWLLYEERSLGFKQFALQDYRAQLGGADKHIFYELLDQYQEQCIFFDDSYELAIKALRKMKSYRDYSETESARNFTYLIELLKNCFQR